MFDTVAARNLDRDVLRAMNDAQTHRGPDGDGEHFEPGVALGHRRLAIIDVAAGHQPIYNEDESVTIVFNGEIYNFAEISTQLQQRGHVFRTHSDTEVIVHAWEEWGPECLRRLNGMFALALYDRNKRTLFLARDRLGKKPLYYSNLKDGVLAFSSELKSLLKVPGLSRRLDHRAIEEYFALGYVPDPKSIFADVKKLPPGHFMLAHSGKNPRIVEYWNMPGRDASAPSSNLADSADELRDRLREATRIRLMSEVPLGAFLSGGVDSSAVVAQMAGLQADPVKTCSISFSAAGFDESAYATQVARQFHTEHRSRQVDEDDFELLGSLAQIYDEPFADSSALPTYRVCQLARQHVTVALSGDGGDEIFGGYRRYRWHLLEEQMRNRIPAGLRRSIFGPLGQYYPKLDWAPRFLRAKSTLESIARDTISGYFHCVSIIPDRERLPMYSAEMRYALGDYRAVELFHDHARRAPTQDPLALVQYIDVKTYLPGDILVKVDRASMAHSLEVRCPFLDYTLVEWSAGLSTDLKMRGAEGKFVLKKSMEGVLSDDILYRPKMGFGVPVSQWFRGPLRKLLREQVLGRGMVDTGLFSPQALERLVDQHQSGRRDHSAALWALLMFSASMQRLGVTGSA